MNASSDLSVVWYFLVGVLFTGYAILDGFDLGVGGLHLFSKTDNERRIMMNSIGPVWDGNEVWLVTAGGALFAAFPFVYAAAFSGFYLVLIFILFSLIFRGVAIEFRSTKPQRWWRQLWDISFSVGSIFSALFIGAALGNIAHGVPLNPQGEYLGTFFDLFNPYAILVGITTIALFMMHGAIYLVMKTEGEFHDKVRGWVNNTIIFFALSYIFTTMVTLLYIPHMAENIRSHDWLLIVPILNMLAIANIPREIHLGHDWHAFLSSSAAVALLLILFGIGMYPNLILSRPVAENSLTLFNAASTHKTQGIMLIIAFIGMPLVIAYTISVYWIFRGKVKLDKRSY